MLQIKFWLVLVFFVAFLSLKQVMNEGEFCANLGNRFLHALRIAMKRCKEENQREKSNMKQFLIAMRNLRMLCEIFTCYAKSSHAMRNLRMLCKIQKDIKFKTNLEHFLESIVYILYVILKLGKLGVQRYKQCANRS